MAAEGAGHHGPLALRVARDVHAPPEGDTAGGKRLRQGGLPPADLAGETDVGIGERSLAVQLPRVVAEGRPGPGVLADQHPRRTEPLFCEEGVGTGQHFGSGPVRDEPEAPIRAARHRAGLAAPCQEGSFALFLAECLDLGPALVHESLAVLELHLTSRPSCSSVRTRRGPARRAVHAGARLERQRGGGARGLVAVSPLLGRGPPAAKA